MCFLIFAAGNSGYLAPWGMDAIRPVLTIDSQAKQLIFNQRGWAPPTYKLFEPCSLGTAKLISSVDKKLQRWVKLGGVILLPPHGQKGPKV